MKVLLIILGVLLLLLILPVGAHVIFDERGFTLRAVFGLLELPLLPRPEKKQKKPKEEKPKKSKKKMKQPAKKAEQPKEKKPLGALLSEYLPMVRLGLRALAGARRLPTIRRLRIRVICGAEDAAAAALHYGAAWGVIGTATALIRGTFRVRRQDVQPVISYETTETRITVDACVTLTLLRLLGWAIHYGVEFLKLQKNRTNTQQTVKNKNDKGGAEP